MGTNSVKGEFKTFKVTIEEASPFDLSFLPSNNFPIYLPHLNLLALLIARSKQVAIEEN